MKTVGIIGGLGPETTAEFYIDVVFACQKLDRRARAPILISSVPLPFQIERDLIAENKGIERIIPYLAKEAQRLEAAGADFLVMPCNSLHVFIEDIRRSVRIPVLSIVEETIKFLRRKHIRKVGLISTSATIKNRVYEHAFERENITYEKPDSFQQAKMGKIIQNLVNGEQNNRDREELIRIIDSFERKDVDCVALACTDLQLLVPSHPHLVVFDTMKILADATVENMLEP